MKHPALSPLSTLSITTLLLAAASAHAQSTSQVYGVLDVAAGVSQASGGVRNKEVSSGNLTTSYLGFRGSEDLGGGLRAIYTLEHYLRLDTGEAGRYNGDSFWSRNANVGLAGGAGTLRLGRSGTSLFTNTLLYNPLGASFGFSPAIRNWFNTGKLAGDSGWNNAIAYASPVMGGVTVELQHAMKEAAQGGNDGIGLRYSSGAFGAGVAAQRVRTAFTRGDETAWQLGASYDFGVAKAFGQYGVIDESDTNAATANTQDTVTQLGVSVPLFSTGTALASWSRASTEGSADYDRTFVTVGYDHRLSKRTDLYGMVMTDKITAKDRGTGWALGVRHAF